jgi:ribonuclease P/MRP protein subunit RPP40
LSGVPQGSIIGPILFVIFINDMAEVVSPDTGLGLYADDTKAWRQINSEEDHIALQNDVQNLFTWSIENKMNFHPKKCKVVSVSNRAPPLLRILPCIQYFYNLGENPLDYADSERDLGVVINSKLNFSDQCNKLLSKAKQMLGLVRRSCYFVSDVKRRRCLYLSLVRSQFEHCSPVWRPTCYTMLQRFENLQKCCINY